MDLLNNYSNNNLIKLSYQGMEGFIHTFSGYMHPNTENYFCVFPNYSNHPFAYYPYHPFLQIQTQIQVLASQTLDVPFASNLPPQETRNEREDFAKVKKEEKAIKGRKTLLQKQQQQQSFNVKIKKNEPMVIYKKKNTQSNIVNQTFSFLNSNRSKNLIIKLLKNSEKTEEYYRILKKVKQMKKKYINRNYLKRLLAFAASSEFEKAFIKAKTSLLTIEELRHVIRVLTFHFLRETINNTLIASGKIYKQALPQHFWRKREIVTFLFENVQKRTPE